MPRRTTFRIAPSVATRHPTGMGSAPSAAGSFGTGASRVQSTAPSLVGSPDATPRVNGFAPSRGGAPALDRGIAAIAALAAAVAHAYLRKRRRSTEDQLDLERVILG